MSDAAESIDVQESAPAEAANESTEGNGLLNPAVEPENTDATPEDSTVPHVQQEQEQATDEDIEWGDRPEWMPENFWDEKEGPDLEALAKSYQEMRAKMSAGKHKAPKDGKYDIAALKDHGVEEDDAMLSQFSEFAKENGLSQDQFDQITQMYVNQTEGPWRRRRRCNAFSVQRVRKREWLEPRPVRPDHSDVRQSDV